MVGDLVLVDWDDAHSNSMWRDATEAYLDHAPKQCHSVGWVMKRDKGGISLFSSWGPNGGEDWEVSETMFIPTGMIRKITVLKKRAKK